MLSLRYREQLAEAFRAVDAGTITKTRERMDRRENQRRAVADSPLGEPDLFDRIWRRVINVSAFIFWTIVLKYAIFKGWPL